MKKKKLEPAIAVNEYVVEGIGLRGCLSAVAHAKKKGYASGHTFTHKKARVRVWLRGHYQQYYKPSDPS